MELKQFYLYFSIFFMGITASDFSWHIRFMNETLRRELIILMRDGDSYFLLFSYISLFFTLILMGITIYYYKKDSQNIKSITYKDSSKSQERSDYGKDSKFKQ